MKTTPPSPSAPVNQAVPADAIAARFLGPIQEAIRMIESLDALIHKQALLLRSIQPYAPGKLEVRFIAHYGGGLPEPTFIAWKRTAATRKTREIRYYDIVATGQARRHIKSYGPFRGTEADVRYLVIRLQDLLDRRKRLRKLVGRFSQAIQISMTTARQTHAEYTADFQVEQYRINERHRARMELWRQQKAAKARQAAEEAARAALPDPADYIDLFELPPEDNTPGEALPDSYVDEDGNYVGP